MGKSGGRSFFATINRISNNGNGVVETDDGGHFIVGPVREEAVGKTVEVRRVGPEKAELTDAALRKDVYARPARQTNDGFSDGDVVTGRVLKRSADGVPMMEVDGVRIEVPGAEFNEEVEVELESISSANGPWATATGTLVGGDSVPEAALIGTVVGEAELYDHLPAAGDSTVMCPVEQCGYSGAPASVAGHVSGKQDAHHDWRRLGYASPTDYKQQLSVTSGDLDSTTAVLHLTDSHLGAALPDSMTYSQECGCLGGFSRAIDVAISRDVDAVLNTGDLFHNDRRGIPDAVEVAAAGELQRLADRGIPFYSIDGDHERDEGRAVLEAFEKIDFVTRLSDEPCLVGDGFALYGRDFAPASEWDSPTWSPMAPDSARFGIAAIHQSVKPLTPTTLPDCTLDDVVAAVGTPVHAVAVGHLHRVGIEWADGVPFVLGGTTEPQRARQATIDPVVGLFTQDGNELAYERIRLPS